MIHNMQKKQKEQKKITKAKSLIWKANFINYINKDDVIFTHKHTLFNESHKTQ
jgi:hypothetical protein